MPLNLNPTQPHARYVLLASMTRHIDITVITLDGKRLRRCLLAGARRQFTPQGVDSILESQANQLEQAFPGRAFHLVPLAGCRFNLVEVPVSHSEKVST